MNTSVGETFKKACIEAWQTFRRNPLFILRVYIIMFVISAIFNFASKGLEKYHETIPGSGLIQVIVGLLSIYLNTLVWIGTMAILLHLLRKERAEIKELFRHSKKVIKVFVTMLLLGLGTFVGLVCLIIPGIYFAMTFHFAALRLVEQDMSIKQAFKESRTLTAGKRWYLFGVYMLIFSVCLLWFLLWGGLLMLLLHTTAHIGVLVFVALIALVTSFIFIPLINFVAMYMYESIAHPQTPVTNPQTVADSLPLAG